MDSLLSLKSFTPALKYLGQARRKLSFINNYHTCHGKLIYFSTAVPVLLYDLCHTLEGTQLVPYRVKSRTTVYDIKICRE